MLISSIAIICTAQDKGIDNYEAFSNRHDQTERELQQLRHETKNMFQKIILLEKNCETFRTTADSLRIEYKRLAAKQVVDNSETNEKINEIENIVATNRSAISNRTLVGILFVIVLIVIMVVTIIYFVRRLCAEYDSMNEIRKAQEALRKAQQKMAEESITLDNKMIELMEKQMATTQLSVASDADHSLTLKVADEIVRIEINLSRMDVSMKGHKQLSKAVQRIKDNFAANGYEIVEMLGKPYNEGMKVIANFVPDDSLPDGAQVITGITKPQVNYKGKMIQVAYITVSQNI